MSGYGHEYNNMTAGSAGCNYTSLCKYYGNGGTMAPISPKAKATSGAFVVPTYGMPGYNTLQHGKHMPGCSTYFNINSAYGCGSGKCNQQYTTMLCGGCNTCPGGGGKGPKPDHHNLRPPYIDRSGGSGDASYGYGNQGASYGYGY
jgi:hypothetical protein